MDEEGLAGALRWLATTLELLGLTGKVEGGMGLDLDIARRIVTSRHEGGHEGRLGARQDAL